MSAIRPATRADELIARRPRWVNAARERRLERIRSDPARTRRALAVTVVAWVALEMAVPRHQVRPIAKILSVIAVWDSTATYVWLRYGIAIEGNPTVVAVIDRLGDGPGLAVRAAFTILLVSALAWAAERHTEGRIGMLVVTCGLGAIAIYHAYILGVVLTWILTYGMPS